MKTSAAVLGILSMFAVFLVLYITFMTAYWSPAKAVRIDINSYGEADVELILLTALLPINLVATYMATRRITDDSIETRILNEKKRATYSAETI